MASTSYIPSNSMGEMKAMLTRFHKETEEPELLADSINDAIESLWRSILLVHLGMFMQGPITNLTIAAGSERVTIVSVADPVAPLVPATLVAGALAGRTLDLYYSLVTESGSETLISPIASVVVPGNSIADVPPPAFVVGAIGWNIYGCLHDGRIAKQNTDPLSFNQRWQEPTDTGVIDTPDLPSAPLANSTADNIFYVRVLQVQNQDGTWHTWQAGDLDSLLMERASRSIASTSTYQGYAYDVINGNTIEIRPALGTTLTPRYFFVVKPRRLRYDNAILPFTNISHTEFVKAYAGAVLDLSNKEYTSYNIKNGKAEKIRQEIVQGLNTQATTKQKTIIPYWGW